MRRSIDLSVLTVLVTLAYFAISCGQSDIKSCRIIDKEVASELRGGAVAWGFVMNQVCVENMDCSQDSCSGDFPIEECAGHVNRVAVPDVARNQCSSKGFDSWIYVCEFTRNSHICSTRTGTCITHQLAPEVFICATTPIQPVQTIVPDFCFHYVFGF